VTAREAIRIREVAARSFRNLASTDLSPGPRFNVFSGENGQGKSNLLEAIHLTGTLTSFRGAGTGELVQHGAESATLGLLLEGSPLPRALKVKLSRERGRSVLLDGKRPRSTLAYQEVARMVLFHPGELELAQGPPEARRTLLDRVLAELEPTYAATLASYVKALRSRNRLLKAESIDRRAIVAFDPVLASAGAILGRARAKLVVELAPVAERAFAEIIGEEVPLRIAFAPRVEPDEAALTAALARSFEKDLARGFTAEGPHADDVALEVKARGAKHNASQGQHRAIVLALKVAELEIITTWKGRVPVLLLDDVSSELDRTRSARFFALLARLGGQVFLTTTHPELIRIEDDRVDHVVAHGTVRRA
jgi:DNA replication and repair protein RecF